MGKSHSDNLLHQCIMCHGKFCENLCRCDIFFPTTVFMNQTLNLSETCWSYYGIKIESHALGASTVACRPILLINILDWHPDWYSVNNLLTLDRQSADVLSSSSPSLSLLLFICFMQIKYAVGGVSTRLDQDDNGGSIECQPWFQRSIDWGYQYSTADAFSTWSKNSISATKIFTKILHVTRSKLSVQLVSVLLSQQLVA